MRNMEHVTDEIFDRLDDGGSSTETYVRHDFRGYPGICRTMITNTEKHKKSKAIRFHAFDTFHLDRMDVPFSERYQRL